MRYQLVVASNRLPVRRTPEGEWTASSGGLVSAMNSVLSQTRDVGWVGWDGSVGEEVCLTPRYPVDLHSLALSKTEVEGFYEGFSNRTLWPLLHESPQSSERQVWWDRYREVNRRFAEHLSRLLVPDGAAWVHDYHLLLVPAMLRVLRPDVRIGFFLHTPFPPASVLAGRFWGRQIAEGMTGADVVGFQTPRDADNFRRLVDRLGSEEATFDRPMVVGSFPISIDVAAFEALANHPALVGRARRLRGVWGNPAKVFLGVDRLDYTKGITGRLRAFARFLERSGRRDVVFVQVAVPSREAIPAYRRYRQEVEALVERINHDFSGPDDRPPIVYVDSALDRPELVAHYAAADVMCVTPLRDGMNLVAKEYVTTKVDGSGALILSQTAGAARELKEALLVDPRDLAEMAEVLDAAVQQPEEEATTRITKMRQTIQENDVVRWAGSFLGTLRVEESLWALSDNSEPQPAEVAHLMVSHRR